jgi:hypothetical protein
LATKSELTIRSLHPLITAWPKFARDTSQSICTQLRKSRLLGDASPHLDIHTRIGDGIVEATQSLLLEFGWVCSGPRAKMRVLGFAGHLSYEPTSFMWNVEQEDRQVDSLRQRIRTRERNRRRARWLSLRDWISHALGVGDYRRYRVLLMTPEARASFCCLIRVLC